LGRRQYGVGGDLPAMGRTIPSFRIALAMEEREWKPFRNALDKSDRKKFEMRCLTSLDFTSLVYFDMIT
jgi:hypothetical protein